VNSLPAEISVVPASFAQQRLWFLDRFEPGSPVYHIPLAVRLTGELDRGALMHAFDEIAARHETLRTTFAVEEDEVVQHIHPTPKWEWREETVRDESELAARLSADARRPFDLTCGPLCRATLRLAHLYRSWRLISRTAAWLPSLHAVQIAAHR
jgi:hypothetical protein